MSLRPYHDLVQSISKAVEAAFRDRGYFTEPPLAIASIVEEPPREELGDLAIPMPRIAKALGTSVDVVYEVVSASISSSKYVEGFKRVGPFFNIFVNIGEYGADVINSLRTYGGEYGIVKAQSPQRIVVEFVSANPIHPLHIGSGRNAALGDFIARILELVGHYVERRYYVNDLGMQVACLVYGYLKAGRPMPPPGIKVDHFLGLIYAATSLIVEIMKLRRRAEEVKNKGGFDEYSRIQTELSGLLYDLSNIKEKIPDHVDRLIKGISADKDPEGSISNIMRRYEEGDPEVTNYVREAVSKVLEGIKETLKELGIAMDRWDWESELVRRGLVKGVIGKAMKSPYFTMYRGVPALDFSQLLGIEGVRERLNIARNLEIPPLILMRGDGTTLYTTRDIAYTLVKFKEFNADRVINVIAIEQTLAQAQLRLALYALNYVREAENLIHYSYEMVNLPGASMSGRRGRYVTVDEMLKVLKDSIKGVVMSRGSRAAASEEVIRRMARSAFKYMMLSASPSKVIVFDVAKAADIKSNSAPYLQYTYARAYSILSKHGKGIEWAEISYEGASDRLRKRLLWLIGKFPDVMVNASVSLHPEDLVSFLNRVADAFNTWYDRDSVLRESDVGLKNLKLAITYGVKVVLENGFKALGIDAIPRI